MKNNWIIALFALISIGAQAQDIPQQTLTLQKAVEIALTNNYDIKVASNELQKTKNKNTPGNAGLLPSLSISAGTDYSNKATELQFMGNDQVLSIDGAESFSYNANVRLDYVLFDGLGNVYTYQKLKNADARQETLSLLQSENTIIQVTEAYYEVCRAQQNVSLADESMHISRKRYQRALDQKIYGKATELDVLNAEVDMNNDSTRILQTEQAYLQTLKNLNVVLGVSIQNNYDVDDSIEFRSDFTAEQVIADALTNNTQLIAQEQMVDLTALDLKITKSKKYPTVSAYGQYAYGRQDNDAGQLLYNQSYGPAAGVSLRFNVFNGRQLHTQEKNSLLDFESQQERSYQMAANVERNASNAFTDYDYKRKIVDLQKRSLKQAQLNFEKTEELFQIGRVTSIEFRTAQQNLLSVAANYNDSKFKAKVAEFYLLQLTGELLSDKD
ncbi:MAG: TolC family protein [Prolixibacteraceae bacterium]